MTRHISWTTRLVSVVIAAGAFASIASAQTSPALKGPEVKDRDVPGVVGDFGNAGAQRRLAERLPPDVFRKALSVLSAADAKPEIRASDEQRAQFKELVDEFEVRVRDYRKAHAKEIGELRQLAGELPARDGKKPAETKPDDDSMQNMSESDQKKRDEARARLRELMEGAPKIEEVYTKVWAGLSEGQRAAVDAELEKFRTQQAKDREDQYVKRQMKKDGAPADAKPKDGEKAKPGEKDEMKPSPVDAKPGPAGERLLNRISPERRERLLRLLAEMTPEEQDQLIQRLEARVKERRPAGAPGRKEAKPAPKPDDVKVPSPDDK